jgi:hypothetical protein
LNWIATKGLNPKKKITEEGRVKKQQAEDN